MNIPSWFIQIILTLSLALSFSASAKQSSVDLELITRSEQALSPGQRHLAINLSDSEVAWLDKKIPIRYVYDPDWAPLGWTNEVGEHTGIMADILQLIGEQSGISFIPTLTHSWREAMNFARDRDADMYSGVGETAERLDYMSFTQKNILSTPYVFVSRRGEHFINGFDDLRDKEELRLAVVEGYAIQSKLQNLYPQQHLVLLTGTKIGLEQLINKDIDVFIINELTAKYFLNMGKFRQLKLAYKTKLSLELKIAIRNDWPVEVISILDKAITEIEQGDLSAIYDRRLVSMATIDLDPSQLYKLMIAALFVIGLVYWWNLKLKAMVTEKTRDLKSQQYDLEQLLQRFDENVISCKLNKYGLITHASEAFCAISGYRKEELIGRSQDMIKHSDTEEKVYVTQWAVISSGKNWQGELKHSTKDGGFFWASVNISPEMDERGEVNCYHVIRHNITDRIAYKHLSGRLEKEVEKQTKSFQDSEQKTRLLLSSVSEGFFGIGNEGLITFINPAALTLLQYDEDELIGKKINHIIRQKKDDGSEYRAEDCKINQSLKKGLVSQVDDEVFWRKDGSSIPVEYKVAPVLIDDEIAGAVVTFNNISQQVDDKKRLVDEVSDRKQSAIIADQAKERLENITNSIPGVVYQLQASGEDISVNFISYGIKLLQNIEPEELRLNFNLFISSIFEEDQTQVVAALSYSINYLQPLRCEYRIITREGVIRWVHMEAVVSELEGQVKDVFLFDEPDDIQKDVILNGNLVDITDAKVAHKVVVEQQNEIKGIHKHTRESIEYAALIQGALMPKDQDFNQHFTDFFTLWQPKDIVGGDIYLLDIINDMEVVIMVIDCTGHGVPGALVTMLVKAVERQLAATLPEGMTISPAWLLGVFNSSIRKLLNQDDSDSLSNAGFDGGILYYNKEKKYIRFAGANVPLFIYQNGEMKMIKGDRHSIGYKKSNPDYEFSEYQIKIDQPTQLYIATDGYFDQNGGHKGFPFGKRRFMELLQDNAEEPFDEQKKRLLDELKLYQQESERNDDVTIIGLKL